MNNKKLTGLQPDLIRRAVRKLPGKIRTVIILRFWHEEEVSSIASYLSLSWKEVRALLERGIRLLKLELGKGFSF